MKKVFCLLVVCSLVFGGIHCSLAADEPVKIAGIFAATGATKIDEELPSFRGIVLAIEELNQAGGLLGHPVELIRMKPTTALEAKVYASRAVEQGVIAVIGADRSSFSLAIAPVLQDAGIPMISTISTNPKVTQTGNYIFRACFTDPFQGKVMARFALRELGAKTAAIITNANSDYSIGLVEFFKENFAPEGTILREEIYQEEAADFSSILQNIAAENPDVVFAPSHARDAALILKQAANMQIDAIFLGGDGWGGKTLLQYAGEAVNGKFFSSHWHETVVTPLSKALVKTYRQHYPEEEIMSSLAPLGYDAMLLLTDAVKRANSLEPPAIRDALAVTSHLQGTTGVYNFDEQGDPLNKEAVILTYENETLRFVKSFTP